MTFHRLGIGLLFLGAIVFGVGAISTEADDNSRFGLMILGGIIIVFSLVFRNELSLKNI